MHPIAEAVNRHELTVRTGRVTALRGHVLESHGPMARVGEICHVGMADGARSVEAEVLGFHGRQTVLMPLGPVEGLQAGARVVATGRLAGVWVGDGLLGRVVDARGQAADGKEPIQASRFCGLGAKPVVAMHRRRIDQPLETGVAVMDTMLTLGRGQRIGLFAGSGVGKSSLMGAMARGTAADVNVIALIGERSREVREFVEDQLGAEGLAKSVVVVATSAEPAAVRVRAAYAATTIAEYFREQGQDVLLLMDSLTRFATGRREMGLALGEPPTARGYTPSVFSELPRLCERSGVGDQRGSITGVYTVLVEGDDLNEPVSDTVRGTLDGHVVLSRDIANQGRYPAVDILRSVSRLHAALGTAADLKAARDILACCSLYERNRQLIEIGAYKPGVNAELDRAVAMAPSIFAFFGQDLHERRRREESLVELRRLAGQLGDQHALR